MRAAMMALLLLITCIASSAPRAAGSDPGPAARGAVLAEIGGCGNCHTAKGGDPLAGGDPLVTPFGTFRAPNITPDPQAGIGKWSLGDLAQALLLGVSPDGSPYYPALPYTSYTNMSMADLVDLKAYLDTVPPSGQPSRPHELAFPFDQRWALHLWQWAFFQPARLVPDPARDAAWNRGAYLVEGPGHCQECHTPRNFAGALDRTRAFAGGPAPSGAAGKIPNISGDPDVGLGKWSTGDFTTLLTLGMTPKGDFVGGEMAKIVNNGTSKLPDADVAAMVAYLKSLPPTR